MPKKDPRDKIVVKTISVRVPTYEDIIAAIPTFCKKHPGQKPTYDDVIRDAVREYKQKNE